VIKTLPASENPIDNKNFPVAKNNFWLHLSFSNHRDRDIAGQNDSEHTPIFSRSKTELLIVNVRLYDKEKFTIPEKIFLQIDNGPLIKTASRLHLEETKIIPSIALATSSFRTGLDTSKLSMGLHTIKVIVCLPGDAQPRVIPQHLTFLIR
jgi:hypothetical protein